MKKKYLILASLLLLIIFSANFAWAGYTQTAPSPVKFENPLGASVTDPGSLLQKVLTNLQKTFVVLAIVMIVIGGIMYMLSFGNEKSMERAKNVILAAVIGFAIAVSANTFLVTLGEVLGIKDDKLKGNSLIDVAGNVLNFLLSVMGIIAIISLVIGGIMYMTSYGNEDQVGKAKKVIVASILGIAISIGSVIIIKQIGNLLGYSF